MEVDVPEDNTSLNEGIEYYLNGSSLVEMFCEEYCKVNVQVEKSYKIKRNNSTEFITIILSRPSENSKGYYLNKNRVKVGDHLFIRYEKFTKDVLISAEYAGTQTIPT